MLVDDFLGGVLLAILLSCRTAAAQAPPPEQTPAPTPAPQREIKSPWLIAPVFSSSPKLGTSGGVLTGYMRYFDPKSRLSVFGAMYQYTSTHSQIAAVFARTSFGADHHRIVAIAAFGNIKNNYDDYLGTGESLKTDSGLAATVARYLYRVKGDWFVGGQGNAMNYQVAGATPEDDLVLETLGVRDFNSVAVGVVGLHDSRDNEDMPTKGWFLNVNNLAYREGLGGSASYDAYRADLRMFWPHGKGHVFAMRQYNWFTHDAPAAAQASVILRGYKLGQYLSPYMSSIEGEERLSFNKRWGATLFAGVAGLYGETPVPLERSVYPNFGGGIHFVLKPQERMIINLEFAQGSGDNRGLYAKLGYAW
jgi:hypothetical protein